MKRLIFIISIFLFAFCAGVIYASPQSLDDGVETELIQSDFDLSIDNVSIDAEFDGLKVISSGEHPVLASNYDGIIIHETNIKKESQISKTEGLFRQVQWKMYISKNLGCLVKN